VKWVRFTVENAAEGEEHFSVKWVRFTVKNAAQTKTRVDSVRTETALAIAEDGEGRDGKGKDGEGR
jgi:hypothetical protein